MRLIDWFYWRERGGKGIDTMEGKVKKKNNKAKERKIFVFDKLWLLCFLFSFFNIFPPTYYLLLLQLLLYYSEQFRYPSTFFFFFFFF